MGTTESEETIGKDIVDCAYNIHKRLGPGLLEKVYEICLAHELEKKAKIKKTRKMFNGGKHRSREVAKDNLPILLRVFVAEKLCAFATGSTKT